MRLAKSGAAKAQAKKPAAKKSEVPQPEPQAPTIESPFVVGAIPGATPGKWIDAWHGRLPDVELELRPIEVADQRSALLGGDLHAALVRLPIDQDGLHVIPLYDEVSVVVSAAESHLMAADELDLADLAGEVIVVARDDVLALAVPGGVTASFAPPADSEEAIAIVAAGVGVVVVPMSLARLHRRKDADYRPLRDGPTSTVALAWRADRTTPAVDAFVGIVRGRTPNSSR
jgi:DNA-binding transcriptional LysR family regulator